MLLFTHISRGRAATDPELRFCVVTLCLHHCVCPLVPSQPASSCVKWSKEWLSHKVLVKSKGDCAQETVSSTWHTWMVRTEICLFHKHFYFKVLWRAVPVHGQPPHSVPLLGEH